MFPALFRSISDLLFPRPCMSCGERLRVDEQMVCEKCMARLYRLRLAWDDNFRLERWFSCLPVKRVAGFTLFKHGGQAAILVHQLKYRGHPELGPWMGQVAARELMPTGLFEGVDALVPIPLSRQRKRQRGYNQAELIARGMAKVTGIPIRTDILRRSDTPTAQAQLRGEERMQNVAKAFSLRNATDLQDRHFMLVDDVMTTGSTMDAALMQLVSVPGIRLTLFAWAWTMD